MYKLQYGIIQVLIDFENNFDGYMWVWDIFQQIEVVSVLLTKHIITYYIVII